MPTHALAVLRVMEQVGAMEIVNGRRESADRNTTGQVGGKHYRHFTITTIPLQLLYLYHYYTFTFTIPLPLPYINIPYLTLPYLNHTITLGQCYSG